MLDWILLLGCGRGIVERAGSSGEREREEGRELLSHPLRGARGRADDNSMFKGYSSSLTAGDIYEGGADGTIERRFCA